MDIIPVLDIYKQKVVTAVEGNRHSYKPIASKLYDSTDPKEIILTIKKRYKPNIIYIADLDAIIDKKVNSRILNEILLHFPEIHFWIDTGLSQIKLKRRFSNFHPVFCTENSQGFDMNMNNKKYICYLSVNGEYIKQCSKAKFDSYNNFISNNVKLAKFNNIQFETINLGNISLDELYDKKIKILNLTSVVGRNININLKNNANYYVFHDLNDKEIKVNFYNSNARLIFLGKYNNSIFNFKFNENNHFSDNSKVDKSNFLQITGCATFYKAILNNIKINAIDGFCEDSVNFINVKGNKISVNISNSKFDAFDADFSEVQFQNIKISNAGNDCADFSFGFYVIKNADIDNCFDKGFSFGETSKIQLSNSIIQNADTAIAVKDSSKLDLIDSISRNVNNCISIYNKKEEFVSGFAQLTNYNCEGQFFSDKDGLIKYN